jgi:hypothetical protein
VASFYGRDLQRYTAFKIHPPSEGPVRQFLFHDKGVICLGTRSVHMAMRRGPALWNIRCGPPLIPWEAGEEHGIADGWVADMRT